ncbi:MAG: S8 family serine peptidase [Gorillibacterium sp.]|nr:S8 family serine peptidase [Gorillibacterium sp.]
MMKKRQGFILPAVVVLMVTLALSPSVGRGSDVTGHRIDASAIKNSSGSGIKDDSGSGIKNGNGSWIMVWKGKPPLAFREESVTDREYPEWGITVSRPKPGADETAWLERWKNPAWTKSVESNQTYQIAQIPNDPMLSHQKYLKQIHVPEAWNTVTGSSDVVVAVVDTGVDLGHPDLAPLLIKGTNLVNPGALPEDDNGHGTNVTGVIAAATNNEKGIAGILWNTKIMPIKALEADGTGDEDRLGEGIRYAVTHGADIVVLSLGLNKPSAYMESIVSYAESKGILLVAASGNEGKAVKYPAAYPTVLAVGGVLGDNSRASLSNYGAELDLVAPWNVFTTSRGGNYSFSGGTSLAAPQAAAVSALMLNMNPQLKPYELRSILRQTTQQLTPLPGWEAETGYGLLRADFAVADALVVTLPTGAASRSTAVRLPLNKQTDAVWGKNESVWYRFETAYKGYVDLDLRLMKQVKGSVLELYANESSQGSRYALDKVDSITLPVEKGLYWVKLTASKQVKADTIYHMTPKFRMSRDPFEDNDRPYTSYRLYPRNHSLKATFDRSGDVDWYSIKVERPGKLRVKVSTDTPRIDLNLMVKREEEEGTINDRHDEGMLESVELSDIKPGLYNIRVGSIERSEDPPTGEYTLKVSFDTDYPDRLEPNNKPYQASELKPNSTYEGNLAPEGDQDWFHFQLTKKADIRLVLKSNAKQTVIPLILMDAKLQKLNFNSPIENGPPSITNQEQGGVVRLERGSYYIKIAPAVSNSSNGGAYRLQMQVLD